METSLADYLSPPAAEWVPEPLPDVGRVDGVTDVPVEVARAAGLSCGGIFRRWDEEGHSAEMLTIVWDPEGRWMATGPGTGLESDTPPEFEILIEGGRRLLALDKVADGVFAGKQISIALSGFELDDYVWAWNLGYRKGWAAEPDPDAVRPLVLATGSTTGLTGDDYLQVWVYQDGTVIGTGRGPWPGFVKGTFDLELIAELRQEAIATGILDGVTYRSRGSLLVVDAPSTWIQVLDDGLLYWANVYAPLLGEETEPRLKVISLHDRLVEALVSTATEPYTPHAVHVTVSALSARDLAQWPLSTPIDDLLGPEDCMILDGELLDDYLTALTMEEGRLETRWNDRGRSYHLRSVALLPHQGTQTMRQQDGCGPGNIHDSVSSRLAVARAAWETSGITEGAVELQFAVCEPPEIPDNCYATLVFGSEPPVGPSGLGWDSAVSPNSVGRLFEIIDSALEARVDTVDVTFHPTLGIPTRIRIRGNRWVGPLVTIDLSRFESDVVTLDGSGPFGGSPYRPHETWHTTAP